MIKISVNRDAIFVLFFYYSIFKILEFAILKFINGFPFPSL